MLLPKVFHRHVDVEGVRVFYRETGPAEAPTLLLLHGFPSASHQFRRLMDALGTRYHLVAPDYPGFGHSGDLDHHTFERLADVVEGFVRAVGLTRFALYAFDFGGPVGFRLATRHPEWITGLVVQNANAYAEGLSEAAQAFVANQDRDVARSLMTLAFTRSQYEDGTTDRTLVNPDSWTLDQHFLDQPGRTEIQVDLALDYHTNVAEYPRWQEWLRTHQPPTLIVWGRGDGIFTEAGAKAYLQDVPNADLHLFDTGHFALEEHAPEIAPLIAEFLDRLPT
ncbi:alpha/beta hydrolase [Saccharothrix mutabilis subsp. mutabilis]|uniref:Alpha/beta hydrolase n=1 Tax=Saccharothrix mutabilis subsp. mutabilis TaxID=66855 RepID=A0ABP3DEJ8_9PSEU